MKGKWPSTLNNHLQLSNVDKTAFHWKKTPARAFMSRDKSKQGFKGQDDSLVVVNVASDFQTTPGLFHFESPGVLENYYSHFIILYM